MSTSTSPSTIGTEDESRDGTIIRLEQRITDLQRSLETQKRGYEASLNLEKRKNGELNEKVKSLMHTIMVCDMGGDLAGRYSNKKLNAACGKDTTHRMKDFIFHIQTQVWRKHKVFPADWWQWKDGDRELCGIMMKKVKMCSGEVKPVFWKAIGVKVFNKTVKNSRGYCNKRLKNETEGECIGFLVRVVVHRLTINLHIMQVLRRMCCSESRL